MTKYKARLILKGYMQRFGVDYREIFAPVLWLNTLRLILCLVARHGWKIRQMDVKTAFLNGLLMMTPKYTCFNLSNLSFKDLSPWCATIEVHLRSQACSSIKEACLYIKRVGKSVVLLSVNVDDITGNDDDEIEKHAMISRANPYRELVGSLQYLVTAIRSDITNAVRNLSKTLSKYDESHWKQAKRVLRYLKGTKSLILTIDYYANAEDRKSVSDFVVLYGGCCISGRSRKQTIVALSTAEAEYTALSEVIKEILWYIELLEELGFPQGPIVVHCDNQSAIAFAKNPGHHERTKHISTKFHFIRDHVEKGRVTLEYCPTKMMIADILTKAIPREQFVILRSKLGITDGPTN
ncbi:Aste57867_22150 [Aphanomyces stellatus]|uniref:Aste57867_22150 protein n=1 Tax=Aphanomyces stellatus TaxID=120398 RepID=A0A485LJM3_9STRA|nr:hypothetical protein As57867_022081 [Aphanomyces stellatus]VFT98817.1 Aste57867_22150 [Aphanomyces stellatus]